MPRNYNKMADEAIRLAGGRVPLPMSKSGAEKLFNRKADPDSYLTPKEFLKKNPPLKPLTDYAKNVVGGAKIVGGAVKSGIIKVGNVIADDLFGSPKTNKLNKLKGKALNSKYSGKK